MNESGGIIRFLATAMGLYIIWYLVYDQWIAVDGGLDKWLSENVAYISGSLLSIFGYASSANATTLSIDGYPLVRVGDSCNGLVLFALFGGFIIAYPGSWKAKLLYIPLGILAIYFLNIIRVIALALNSLYSRNSLDFNHKYTFTFIVYACIFGFWMYWVKRYAKSDKNAVTA